MMLASQPLRTRALASLSSCACPTLLQIGSTVRLNLRNFASTGFVDDRIASASPDRAQLDKLRKASRYAFETVAAQAAASQLKAQRAGAPKLLPHQIEAGDSVLRELEKGKFTRIGVNAATGSGKSVMVAYLLEKLPDLIHPETGHKAQRVLVIVPSISLAHQLQNTVKLYAPRLSIGVDQGRANKASPKHDIIIATRQTACLRLENYVREDFKAILFDEAHHSNTSSCRSVLKHFMPSFRFQTEFEDLVAPHAKISPGFECGSVGTIDASRGEARTFTLDNSGQVQIPVIGFSSTWQRGDGSALGQIFEKIVYNANFPAFMRAGLLAPAQLIFYEPVGSGKFSRAGIDASGEFKETELKNLLYDEKWILSAVQAVKDHAEDRRSILAFATDIETGRELSKLLNSSGISAFLFSSEVPEQARQIMIKLFAEGKFKVMINVDLNTEGVNLPFVDCVLCSRPTRSLIRFVHMMGRGLRVSPETGKNDCLILAPGQDAVPGLICKPTLLGKEMKIAQNNTSNAVNDSLQPARRDLLNQTVENSYQVFPDILNLINEEKMTTRAWREESRAEKQNVNGPQHLIDLTQVKPGWQTVVEMYKAHLKRGQ